MAADFIAAMPEAGFHLVHGRPTLHIEPFIEYGHAWVEKGDLVMDFTCGFIGPRMLYYDLGKIDSQQSVAYTRDQALDRMLVSGHYGPWEEH